MVGRYLTSALSFC